VRTLFCPGGSLYPLAPPLPRLRNFSVAVKEWNDEIVFLRRTAIPENPRAPRGNSKGSLPQKVTSRQLPEHEETNERKMKHVIDTQWVNHSHPRKAGSHSEANIA
jgi:hypothetical protein